MEFKENSTNTGNIIDKYILISKQVIFKIISQFFLCAKNIFSFSFSNKISIVEEPFFVEECLYEFRNRVRKLENNDITNDIIKIVKDIILDINIFIIILKKSPTYIIKEINLLNVLSHSEIKIDNIKEIYNKYVMKKIILDNSFNDGFKYELNSTPIKSVLPILEKNIIILILYNPKNKRECEIRLYNINNIGSNNYLYKKCFLVPIAIDGDERNPKVKLYKIDYRKILFKYKYDFHTEPFFTFFDIEYNENEKPINIIIIKI